MAPADGLMDVSVVSVEELIDGRHAIVATEHSQSCVIGGCSRASSW